LILHRVQKQNQVILSKYNNVREKLSSNFIYIIILISLRTNLNILKSIIFVKNNVNVAFS